MLKAVGNFFNFSSDISLIFQVTEWERNLENLHVDQFQIRCYLSAVEGSTSPNPQSLLTYVSKTTKQFLAKLGMFSVASFHAFVSVREAVGEPPPKANKNRRGRGTVGLKSKLMQSLKLTDHSVVSAIRSKHSPRLKRCFFTFSFALYSLCLTKFLSKNTFLSEISKKF